MEEFVLSLLVHPHSSSLLELSRPSGLQIFWKLFLWAAAEGTWATKGGSKKHMVSKGRKLGQKRHCYAGGGKRQSRGRASWLAGEDDSIRLTGNSQAVLNTSTAETWPSSEDTTDSIKHFEGQNLG